MVDSYLVLDDAIIQEDTTNMIVHSNISHRNHQSQKLPYLVMISLISEASMQLNISSFSFYVCSQTEVGINISLKLLK